MENESYTLKNLIICEQISGETKYPREYKELFSHKW